MDIRLSIKNRKDRLNFGIFIFFMLLFFYFIYLPKFKEVKRLETEYKRVNSQIEAIYNFIGTKENLEEHIIKMREGLMLLERAFPFEKDLSNIIRHLNDEAKRFNVKVISLKPKDSQIHRDHGGAEVKIGDCFCKEMPLTLGVEARYQALGEFLLSLETNKSPFFSVKSVDIEKDKEISPRLKIELQLTTYILGE